MEDRVKVSIIVPVYNTPEKALRHCLDSTLNQTMREIEILVVDDGSTDGSGAICDEYARKDKRMTVIHKSNGGLSAARNTGYRQARGEWIMFLDSDDWIESAACEESYRLGVKSSADVVIFGTVQEFEHYKNPFKYHIADGQLFLGQECKKLQCEILDFNGNIATAWAKLIRKELLDREGIEHKEALRQGSEGIEFNIRLFERITSAFFTDKVYYHYVYNPNSISAKHDEKNHQYVIRCFEEIEKQIQRSSNREALEALFYTRFAYVVVAAAISGYFSPANPQSFPDRKRSFEDYLKNQLVQEALKKSDRRQMGKQRRIVLRLIEHRLWAVIQCLAWIRYQQKH